MGLNVKIPISLCVQIWVFSPKRYGSFCVQIWVFSHTRAYAREPYYTCSLPHTEKPDIMVVMMNFALLMLFGATDYGLFMPSWTVCQNFCAADVQGGLFVYLITGWQPDVSGADYSMTPSSLHLSVRSATSRRASASLTSYSLQSAAARLSTLKSPSACSHSHAAVSFRLSSLPKFIAPIPSPTITFSPHTSRITNPCFLFIFSHSLLRPYISQRSAKITIFCDGACRHYLFIASVR